MYTIDRDAAVEKLTEMSDTLIEPLKSHTLLIALYLKNEADFPAVKPEFTEEEMLEISKRFGKFIAGEVIDILKEKQ